jgi:hypothetical protein
MTCYSCGVSKGPGKCGNCGVPGSAFSLSDMNFDEVSFVQRGANQKAHVVLWKSDTEHQDDLPHVLNWWQRTAKDYEHVLHKSEEQPVSTATTTKLWDLLSVARELQEANPGMNVAEAIAKSLERDPGLYSSDMTPWFEPEPVQKSSGLSFELESAAERMQEAHPDLTFAECVSKALDRDPSLYR